MFSWGDLRRRARRGIPPAFLMACLFLVLLLQLHRASAPQRATSMSFSISTEAGAEPRGAQSRSATFKAEQSFYSYCAVVVLASTGHLIRHNGYHLFWITLLYLRLKDDICNSQSWPHVQDVHEEILVFFSKYMISASFHIVYIVPVQTIHWIINSELTHLWKSFHLI